MSVEKFEEALRVFEKDYCFAGFRDKKLVFAPLRANPQNRGASVVEKIRKKTIVFRRRNSDDVIGKDVMKTAYEELDKDLEKGNEEARKMFQNCCYTFFLQFLKQYGLAEISGSGVAHDPYVVVSLK